MELRLLVEKKRERKKEREKEREKERVYAIGHLGSDVWPGSDAIVTG